MINIFILIKTIIIVHIPYILLFIYGFNEKTMLFLYFYAEYHGFIREINSKLKFFGRKKVSAIPIYYSSLWTSFIQMIVLIIFGLPFLLSFIHYLTEGDYDCIYCSSSFINIDGLEFLLRGVILLSCYGLTITNFIIFYLSIYY